MNKDLKTAFREIFFSYGAALLESEQLVNYLSDWQIGIDKPTKNVVRAIVNQGYGKRILGKAKVRDLKFEESKYWTKEISEETGFMPELVKNVIEAIFYGLNVEEERIRSMPVSLSKSVLAMSHLTIDDFFPIEGMVLGKSTWGDAENLKYPIKTYSGGKYIDTKNGVTFLDHNSTGVFSCLLIEDEKIPTQWNHIGIKPGMSYQSWMKWLENNSFKIKVIVEPKIVTSEERNVLCALVEAIDRTNTIKISLDFNCGNKNNEGCSVTSSNSLYTIYFDILC